MAEKLINPATTKLENKKVSEAVAEKWVERDADKAAEKASHTENRYDEDHQLFSK